MASKCGFKDLEISRHMTQKIKVHLKHQRCAEYSRCAGRPELQFAQKQHILCRFLPARTPVSFATLLRPDFRFRSQSSVRRRHIKIFITPIFMTRVLHQKTLSLVVIVADHILCRSRWRTVSRRLSPARRCSPAPRGEGPIVCSRHALTYTQNLSASIEIRVQRSSPRGSLTFCSIGARVLPKLERQCK